METKPYVWQMIKEAVEQSEKKVISNKEIKDYILKKYGDTNLSTINCQILTCSVNTQSRVNWPENKKPRISNGQYDFLYNVGRGQVEIYDPKIHGQWEICLVDSRLIVKKVDDELTDNNDDVEQDTDVDTANLDKNFTFALESQLRDFIAQNLTLIDNNLNLYVSDDGLDGVEYRTDIGIIDILAQNKSNEFVVIELKLSRGSDAVLGQLQRYMGWVKKNLSNNMENVHGVIIAKSINDRLKYAVSVTQNISLFEYSMNFDIAKTGI